MKNDIWEDVRLFFYGMMAFADEDMVDRVKEVDRQCCLDTRNKYYYAVLSLVHEVW